MDAVLDSDGPAVRPEDLSVTPSWYQDGRSSLDASAGPCERSSYPSRSYNGRETAARSNLPSTGNSSVEDDVPRVASYNVPRKKAYMDLRDAIALLDETCPNQQEPSPSITPRTPRTPLTPYPRNKRARSKSSDNSSNYSNDRLSERSSEMSRSQERGREREREREREKEKKKKPFLRKIGISKTEDRPFLAKLAPRITGKPYLEKIGPSKAVDRPHLDNNRADLSCKMRERFTFEAPRDERKTKDAPLVPPSSSLGNEESSSSSSLLLLLMFPTTRRKEERDSSVREKRKTFAGEEERARSGKRYLLKMYSFETEDVEDSKGTFGSPSITSRRDPLRGASLDDVLEHGPSSLPPVKSAEGQSSLQLVEPAKSRSAVELVRCRMTSCEEIVSPRLRAQWEEGASSASKTRQRQDDGNGLPSTTRDVGRTTNASPTRRLTYTSSSSSLGSRGKESTVPVLAKRNEDAASISRTASWQIIEDRKQREGCVGYNVNEQRPSSDGTGEKFPSRGDDNDNDNDDNDCDPAKEHRRSAKGFVVRCRSCVESFGEHQTRRALESREGNGRAIGYDDDSTRDERFEPQEKPLAGNYEEPERHVARGLLLDIAETPGRKTLSRDTGNDNNDESSFSNAKKSQENSRPPLRREARALSSDVVVVVPADDRESEVKRERSKPSRQSKRRILREASQETIDLLAELRKARSSLRTVTPSPVVVDNRCTTEEETNNGRAPRFPKKILLTDKEFCLSFERENGARASSTRPAASFRRREASSEDRGSASRIGREPLPSAALFEKRCLSLDYADDERPERLERSEIRAISLVSARSPPSETEGTVDSSELALICDSKSYCSDVFNTPSEDADDREREGGSCSKDSGRCPEVVDIAIPIDQRNSPRKHVQIQARTSDAYEIISPRSTSFRVTKRLGRISIEETVKQSSFTLDKVDCRSVVVQKRTKCFPL